MRVAKLAVISVVLTLVPSCSLMAAQLKGQGCPPGYSMIIVDEDAARRSSAANALESAFALPTPLAAVRGAGALIRVVNTQGYAAGLRSLAGASNAQLVSMEVDLLNWGRSWWGLRGADEALTAIYGVQQEACCWTSPPAAGLDSRRESRLRVAQVVLPVAATA